jgi:hypothetical protein
MFVVVTQSPLQPPPSPQQTKALRPNQSKAWFRGHYSGVDYNLTLCTIQSRLQRIYQWQPYAKVDLNPMPESTLSPTQGLWIWPLSAELF